jgi:hypothetical protein
VAEKRATAAVDDGDGGGDGTVLAGRGLADAQAPSCRHHSSGQWLVWPAVALEDSASHAAGGDISSGSRSRSRSVAARAAAAAAAAAPGDPRCSRRRRCLGPFIDAA